MAVPFSNTKLRVPKGFQNILEGLAREVLRSQPDDIFEFGSKYFEQLLKVRQETGHDPAVHGARLEDRFYNNDSFKSPDIDAGSKEQQDAALTIQTNYRKHAAEQEVAGMREEDAAEKIQAGFHGYQDRKKFQDMKRKQSDESGVRSPAKQQEEEEEVDIDLDDPEVEQAALKIQAGFKGFKARQEIKELKEEKEAQQGKQEEAKQDEEEVDIDLEDPEVQGAALKIQAGFKGMKARQEIKALKESKETEQQESKEKEKQETKQEEEEVDIDLNDPETEKAAIKIQAGFKGYKTRKEMKDKKEGESAEGEKSEEKVDEKTEEQTDDKKDEEIDIDLNDPEVEKAATKIQAGFKGYKTRKEMKDSGKEAGTDVQKEEEGEQKQDEVKQEEEKQTEEKQEKTEG